MATVNGHAELDPVLNPVSSSLSQSPPSLIDPGESTDTSDEHHEHGVQNGNGEAQPAENAAEPPQSAFVRRSSRRSMPVKPFDSFGSSNTTAPTPTNGSRRNPKRKASDPVKQLTSPPGELLKEALRPLEPSDIEDWEGWIELESEPAFFTIILRDLGIQDVKAQELFTLDQESINFLPKPVYGLIFLFEYHPALDEEGEKEDIGDLWFANQVTQNACATVALLNIVMNVPEIHFGPQLSEFKESTAHLSTALRGHKLSSDAFIRRTHNSFTRRMNHLNADLALENEASRPKPKKTKTAATPGKKAAKGKAGNGAKATRKRVEPSTYGYHFIAYVPAGGDVWELDGLKASPHRLGRVDSEDWTAVVRPQIEARMLQYEETQLSFNLLALCRSPLVGYTVEIASAVSALRRLHRRMRDSTAFRLSIPREDPIFCAETDYTDLPEFDLSISDIEAAPIPDNLYKTLSRSNLSVKEAVTLYGELVVAAKVAIGEYRGELLAMADDDKRVQGRKRDFGPALHSWVTKLAEKGVLENIINDTQ